MSSRPVVIVGPEKEPHAQAILQRLRDRSVDARLLDTQRFPSELRLALGDELRDTRVDGEPWQPASVYVRDLGLSPVSLHGAHDSAMEDNWRQTMLALRERSDLIVSLLQRWESAGVPVYNPQTTRNRITKPYQLGLLAGAGLPVPATCWTNDPAAVRDFAKGRRVAYKPVAGGAATKELSAEDLTDERLELLAGAPVCFQELLPGDDIRVYIIDGEIIASVKIETEALDFRQNETGLVPFELTPELRDVCKRAVDVLGLRFTGMDLKGNVDGEFKILELNPSPMFLGFDSRAGTDIADRLAAALASHA